MMLFDSPQARRCPSLERVICCHFPVVPAQTSGAWSNEFRTTALAAASPENSALSAPFHEVSTLPDARSSVEMAEFPEMSSVMMICLDDGDQRNQFGDDLRFGVRSRAWPPPAGSA